MRFSIRVGGQIAGCCDIPSDVWSWDETAEVFVNRQSINVHLDGQFSSGWGVFSIDDADAVPLVEGVVSSGCTLSHGDTVVFKPGSLTVADPLFPLIGEPPPVGFV